MQNKQFYLHFVKCYFKRVINLFFEQRVGIKTRIWQLI